MSALVAAALFGCSNDGDYDDENDLTTEVVACEEAYARLERCCPDFRHSRSSCLTWTRIVVVGTIVFVIGTGTDIGKTHVTRALALAAGAPAWKPVTSGGNEDVVRLAAEPPLHALSAPVSPHLAARMEGITLDAHVMAAAAAERARGVARLLVESAGGLYSPLSDRETNADVARALAAVAPVKVLLVAPDRLGVLHDVAATLRAAHADGIVVACVALSAPAHPDASTGTNAAELVRVGAAREVVTFPRASVDDAATLAAARACLSVLGIDASR